MTLEKLQVQYTLFLLPLSSKVMLTLIIIPGSAAKIMEFDFWGSFFGYFRLGGVNAFCLFLGQDSGRLSGSSSGRTIEWDMLNVSFSTCRVAN